ncbi:antiterminator [Providencia rettgeri]|uniref:antiterminator Q family protein n=1 Tax=Providencia sp. PROV265 TaxID=2949953 RepID=UPI00234AEE18|nr:antiterminator Q family protein [Providencia sp. PROV265]EJD6506548.1 antiterminator [Providencia rettgeri]
MSSIKSISDGLVLDAEQEAWLQGWLSKFGAWVYSGRLEKRQSSIIAEFMATVEKRDYPEREMCNDDDGMLITKVVDKIYHIDRVAFTLLLLRYAFVSSDRAIARYYYGIAQPRQMVRRNRTLEYRKPSMATCRREVKEIIRFAEYLIYPHLYNAFKIRDNEWKKKNNSKNVLTSLNQ